MIERTFTKTNVSICFDPLQQTASFLLVKKGEFIATGRPFLIITNHFLKAYDLIYSSFEVNEANHIVQNPVPVYRDMKYITAFTLEKVQEISAQLSSLTDNFTITYYKHPVNDEYALPWCTNIINKLMPEPPLEQYEAFYDNAVLAGIVKTRTEMIADGWL